MSEGESSQSQDNIPVTPEEAEAEFREYLLEIEVLLTEMNNCKIKKIMKTIVGSSKQETAIKLLDSCFLEEGHLEELFGLLIGVPDSTVASAGAGSAESDIDVYYTDYHSGWKSDERADITIGEALEEKFKSENRLIDFENFLKHNIHFISAVPIYDTAFSYEKPMKDASPAFKKYFFLKLREAQQFYPFYDKNTGDAEREIIRRNVTAFFKTYTSENIDILLLCIRHQLRLHSRVFWGTYHSCEELKEEDELSFDSILGTSLNWAKFKYFLDTQDRIFTGEVEESAMGLFKISPDTVDRQQVATSKTVLGRIEKMRLSTMLYDSFIKGKKVILVDNSCQTCRDVCPGTKPFAKHKVPEQHLSQQVNHLYSSGAGGGSGFGSCPLAQEKVCEFPKSTPPDPPTPQQAAAALAAFKQEELKQKKELEKRCREKDREKKEAEGDGDSNRKGSRKGGSKKRKTHKKRTRSKHNKQKTSKKRTKKRKNTI